MLKSVPGPKLYVGLDVSLAETSIAIIWNTSCNDERWVLSDCTLSASSWTSNADEINAIEEKLSFVSFCPAMPAA